MADDNATPTTEATPQVSERDQMLADMAKLGDEETPAAEPAKTEEAEPASEKKTEEATEETDTEQASAEESEDATSEEEDEGEETEEEPASATEKTDDAPDPALSKKLAALQKAEKRAKESIAHEREQLEAMRHDFREKAKRIEEFERIAKQAKYNPAAVLMSLGLTAEDMDDAARDVYRHSKAAADNPKLRAAAAQTMRERELRAVMEAQGRELAEIKEQLATQQTQKQVEGYISTVAKAASDETPLVRAMLENNPDGARKQLTQVADYLSRETGEIPEPLEVLKALESMRQNELKELGIDPAQVIPSKNKPSVAGETKAAKTLKGNLSTPTKPRAKPKDPEEERADLIRAIESGKFE